MDLHVFLIPIPSPLNLFLRKVIMYTILIEKGIKRFAVKTYSLPQGPPIISSTSIPLLLMSYVFFQKYAVNT